jgi:RNA polymerase sigma factor (sigma-70 family)
VKNRDRSRLFGYLIFARTISGIMYNDPIMISGESASSPRERPSLLHPVLLFRLCASNRENSEAWSEFLYRYSSKLKFFIRGTIRQILGSSGDPNNSIVTVSMQESDLYQNTILRLVENNCAAMKRFSGKTEDELLAYLAVISRSTVIDALRRSNAIKRRTIAKDNEKPMAMPSVGFQKIADNPGFERQILANELISLVHQTIKSRSGQTSARDQLAFELHFIDGLSFSQISRCKGINLSKAGVEKLLGRLISRVQDSLQPMDSR